MFYDPRNRVSVRVRSEEMWSENLEVKKRRALLFNEKVNGKEVDSLMLDKAEKEVTEYLVAQVFETIAECNFFSKDAEMAFVEFLQKVQFDEVKNAVIERLKTRRQQCTLCAEASKQEQEDHRAFMEYQFAKMKVNGLKRELEAAENALQTMKQVIGLKHSSLFQILNDD